MLSTKTRKAIAALVAGAFIIAGIAGPLAAQAATPDKERPAQHQRHQINPEKAAKRLAAEYGLDEGVIAKYQKEGKTFKDLGRAAFLAKASGKSFEAVLALKTDKNTWKEVTKTLGVDKAKTKAVRQELAVKRITNRSGLDQSAIQNLFDQGYHTRDIAMAAMLAKQTAKSIDQVITHKKINNTWKDVAKELGVDLKALKKQKKAS